MALCVQNDGIITYSGEVGYNIFPVNCHAKDISCEVITKLFFIVDQPVLYNGELMTVDFPDKVYVGDCGTNYPEYYLPVTWTDTYGIVELGDKYINCCRGQDLAIFHWGTRLQDQPLYAYGMYINKQFSHNKQILENLPPLINKFNVYDKPLRPYSHIDPLFNCVKIGDKPSLTLHFNENSKLEICKKTLDVYKKIIHPNYYRLTSDVGNVPMGFRATT